MVVFAKTPPLDLEVGVKIAALVEGFYPKLERSLICTKLSATPKLHVSAPCNAACWPRPLKHWYSCLIDYMYAQASLSVNQCKAGWALV